MGERGVEGVLIGNMNNVRYFSGFTGSSGYLVVTVEEAYFLTDARYTHQAESEVSGFELKEISRPWVDIPEFLKGLGLSTLGFEGAYLPFDSFKRLEEALPGVTIFSLADGIDGIRSVKDPCEIEAIERAAEIASSALMETIPIIKEGVCERDIAIELDYRLKKKGAERAAFDTIVLSGERTALPHGRPSSRKIGYREPVIIDFGALWEGYHSDETWSFSIGGFEGEMDRIYRVVKEAHDRAIEAVRPGVDLREIDRVARDTIERAGYGHFFGHGTGHGVGLSVHEGPRVSPYSDGVVEEGMVFTIEPAIYIPDLGGVRVEDMVVVTPSGFRVLTRTPKDGAILC